jgi:hypothetical protein
LILNRRNFLLTLLQSQSNDDDDVFAEIDNFGKNSTQDALDTWLDSPPIANVDDPIAWWSSMTSSGDRFAHMALDFLSTPGMLTINFTVNIADIYVELLRPMLSTLSQGEA